MGSYASIEHFFFCLCHAITSFGGMLLDRMVAVRSAVLSIQFRASEFAMTLFHISSSSLSLSSATVYYVRNIQLRYSGYLEACGYFSDWFTLGGLNWYGTLYDHR